MATGTIPITGTKVINLLVTKTFESGYVDILYSDYAGYGVTTGSILFFPDQYNANGVPYKFSTRNLSSGWRIYADIVGGSQASGSLTFRAMLII